MTKTMLKTILQAESIIKLHPFTLYLSDFLVRLRGCSFSKEEAKVLNEWIDLIKEQILRATKPE